MNLSRKSPTYSNRAFSGSLKKRSYIAPGPPLKTRIFNFIFNRWTGLAVLAASLIALSTFFYFWQEYSAIIDRKLLGTEIFTPTAGIYSAPRIIRTGEDSGPNQLIEYLRSAGYIDKNGQGDQSRSRYSFDGARLTIEPGTSGIIDGVQAFKKLVVIFNKNLKGISAIQDAETGQMLKTALLEPKMLSTIAAEGGRRRIVSYGDLPESLIKAIVVTEDRSFFEHHGVNFRGIARAIWKRYDTEDDSPISNQGGSSITQQLVKNLLLSPEPTLERKAKEAFMSIILETRLTKQEIFTLYVNQIYLGQQSGVSIYGVGEAANTYFGKDVTQLTLPESAFIAGIIRSPNRYNPYKNRERVEERRNQVLASMLEAGQITQQEYDLARAVPLELKQVSNLKDLQGMPYFSQYVIEQLPKYVSDPEALQHLRIYTSIDPELQSIAYRIVAERLEKLDKLFAKKPKGTLNAALVALKPKTGEIIAMVGGRDYLANQFNRATDAMRQPGSVFKPFVYTTAINSPYEGTTRIFTAASIFKDEKKVFTFGNETYSPNNFGDYFSNEPLTLRDALVKSKNTITVDLAMQLNIGRVMNLAAKAGFPQVERAYPSMALGTAEATPLQVATAYTMLANLGERALPMPITRIAAGDGRVIKLVEPDRKTVVKPDVAYIVDDILKDVINRGTAASAAAWGFRNVPGERGFAGKTGTSRDGWFAGFTPEIVCVVYVGFDEGTDLGLKGADSALPIWADFMKEALERYPEFNGDWQMPPGIRRAEIDIRDGSLIQELDSTPVPTPTPTPTPEAEPTATPLSDPNWSTEFDLTPKPSQPILRDVPKEFRRVELFVAGTLPLPQMSVDNGLTEPTPMPEAEPLATPYPLPPAEENQNATPDPSPQEQSQPDEKDDTISLVICPASGLRATPYCPVTELRTFRRGREPAGYCNLHR